MIGRCPAEIVPFDTSGHRAFIIGAKDFRHTKARDHGRPVEIDKDITSLQVSMHDSDGVKILQPECNIVNL